MWHYLQLLGKLAVDLGESAFWLRGLGEYGNRPWYARNGLPYCCRVGFTRGRRCKTRAGSFDEWCHAGGAAKLAQAHLVGGGSTLVSSLGFRDSACDPLLPEKLLRFEGIVAFAPQSKVCNGSLSADGKGLAMLELEEVALLTAPSSLVDKCALAAIAREDFSPHCSRHVPRTPLCLDARIWIRILCLRRALLDFLARRVQLTFRHFISRARTFRARTFRHFISRARAFRARAFRARSRARVAGRSDRCTRVAETCHRLFRCRNGNCNGSIVDRMF